MHKSEKETILYLMHCIAVGDYDASFFVEDKETLFATDDRCYYIFTICKGPIIVENEQMDFIADEKINK